MTDGQAYLMSFTDRGYQLAGSIAQGLKASERFASVRSQRVIGVKEHVSEIFTSGNLLIFVGAVGIAVRAIAPFLVNKTVDPAVVVVDEAGRFVVPILSGHLGGANRYAHEIANLIDAEPVITTATDATGAFSIDTFARENGYAVMNSKSIKPISAAILAGQSVGLHSEFAISGQLPLLIDQADSGSLGIYIGLNQLKPFARTLWLAPKCIHLGIGARRGVDEQDLEQFCIRSLAGVGLMMQVVASISSVDIKQDEPALKALAAKYRIPFHTYSAAELEVVGRQFKQSQFVQSVAGTGNVCEAAAYISSGQGRILLPKTAHAGMTLAIAEQTWKVEF